MFGKQLIKQLPSVLPREEIERKLINYNDWFYDFLFDNGARTYVGDELTRLFHSLRTEMIFPMLDEVFHDRWDKIRCLDIASHQGWFSFQLALRGASEVVGMDLRDEHIKKANLIKELSGIGNVNFSQKNLYEIEKESYGEFDLVLFIGILYHLDNPVQALKIARSMTKNLCVIETQVAKAIPSMECEWGSSSLIKRGEGIIVIESDEGHSEKGRSVALVPTLQSLYQMLYAVGFKRIYLSIPRNDMYKQFANYDRVIVFAQV